MISILLPVMRPRQVLSVLSDLNDQIIIPNRVVLVDNSGKFDLRSAFDGQYRYHLDVIRPGENIGVNKVWNMMWDKKFEEYEYIGVLGDDYRLNKYSLLRMLHILQNTTLKAVTCLIKQGTHLPPDPSGLGISVEVVRAKGHLGFSLFNREWLVKNVPRIPSQFKVFFGDDWIGYHIQYAKENVNCLTDTVITHYHYEDISFDIGTREILREERIIWKRYLRGEIEL